ncbi:hypothetical protein ADK57_13960 [Streptomyces sp. MMG1533]|nr:hypothetical protein ADK57_13960 [Streptomyces sp. MMG1533]
MPIKTTPPPTGMMSPPSNVACRQSSSGQRRHQVLAPPVDSRAGARYWLIQPRARAAIPTTTPATETARMTSSRGEKSRRPPRY